MEWIPYSLYVPQEGQRCMVAARSSAGYGKNRFILDDCVWAGTHFRKRNRKYRIAFDPKWVLPIPDVPDYDPPEVVDPYRLENLGWSASSRTGHREFVKMLNGKIVKIDVKNEYSETVPVYDDEDDEHYCPIDFERVVHGEDVVSIQLGHGAKINFSYEEILAIPKEIWLYREDADIVEKYDSGDDLVPKDER